MKDVFEQGREAYRAGKTEQHNPWVVGGDQDRWHWWRAGFRAERTCHELRLQS